MPNFARSLPALFRVSSGRQPFRRAQSAPSFVQKPARKSISTPPAIDKQTIRKSLKSRAANFFRKLVPCCLKAQEEEGEGELADVESTEENAPIASSDGYDCTSVLGEGGFGMVLLATRRSDDQTFAIKAMARAHIEETTRIPLFIKQEEEILQSNRGKPFLASIELAIRTPEWIHFVMPCYNGGELYDLVVRQGQLDLNTAKFYAAELILAVSTLHEAGFIHRDIKSENVLLDAEGHVVLSDFGLCHRITTSRDDPHGDRCCWTRSGTISCFSPEMLDPSCPPFGRPADWWAVGVIIFDMLVGNHPFYNGDLGEFYLNAPNASLEYFVRIFGERVLKLPYPAVELLAGLLTVDPEMRLGSGPDGVAHIQGSQFFEGVDWDALKAKRIPSPFQPDAAEFPMLDKPVPDSLRFIPAPSGIA